MAKKHWSINHIPRKLYGQRRSVCMAWKWILKAAITCTVSIHTQAIGAWYFVLYKYVCMAWKWILKAAITCTVSIHTQTTGAWYFVLYKYVKWSLTTKPSWLLAF